MDKTKKRKKTKLELLIELRKTGFSTTKKRYLLSEVEALCNERNIAIEIEEPEVKLGWYRKPKGMLQVLWERGWINPAISRSRYTKEGKKEDFDAEGNLTEEGKKYCLSYLIQNCRDFKE